MWGDGSRWVRSIRRFERRLERRRSQGHRPGRAARRAAGPPRPEPIRTCVGCSARSLTDDRSRDTRAAARDRRAVAPAARARRARRRFQPSRRRAPADRGAGPNGRRSARQSPARLQLREHPRPSPERAVRRCRMRRVVAPSSLSCGPQPASEMMHAPPEAPHAPTVQVRRAAWQAPSARTQAAAIARRLPPCLFRGMARLLPPLGQVQQRQFVRRRRVLPHRKALMVPANAGGQDEESSRPGCLVARRRGVLLAKRAWHDPAVHLEGRSPQPLRESRPPSSRWCRYRSCGGWLLRAARRAACLGRPRRSRVPGLR